MSRDPLDRYYTPAWATRALLHHLRPWLSEGLVWEPCAGDGAIVDVLHEEGLRVLRSDVDPDQPWDHVDATCEPPQLPVTAVITNPPYSTPGATAAQVIRNTRQHARVCAYLLRTAWLEACDDRLEMLRDDPPGGLLLLPRVAYRLPGGALGHSPHASCWVVWGAWAGVRVVSRAEAAGWGR